MVKMKLTSGPYVGRERDVTGMDDPLELLVSCVEHGWAWEIDWSQATAGEKFEWGRADMSARILRALATGRTVIFLGVVYSGIESAGEVEDAIVNSGRMVTVVKDDEKGVVIEAVDFVQ